MQIKLKIVMIRDVVQLLLSTQHKISMSSSIVFERKGFFVSQAGIRKVWLFFFCKRRIRRDSIVRRDSVQ